MSWQNRVEKLINLDIKKEIISKGESDFVVYFSCLNGCVGW